MADQQPDENNIRQYLLGRLDAASELTEDLEERLLTDSEFSELADIIEDEIIEDYLEGSLEPADRDAVERHFLRPTGRRNKLRNARRFYQHMADRVPDKEELSTVPGIASRLQGRLSWSSWTAWAATLVLFASVGYLVHSRRGLQSAIARSTNDLAREREHSSSLAEQLRGLAGLKQPTVAMLELKVRGRDRTAVGPPLPQLVVGEATQRIHVEIVLQDTSSAPYHVRLETAAGKTIWTTDQVSLASADACLLIFDIPARLIGEGDYQVVLTRPGDPGESPYLFHILRS